MDERAENVNVPTDETYNDMTFAYEYFNRRLFDGELPPCIITYQRNKRVMGYVSRARWVNAENRAIDELALNPEYFAGWPIQELMSTLCHEQCHLMQLHSPEGKPGRRGYHNQQFAKIMRSIGLQASTTGRPGGKSTGEQMDHYILADGPFINACEELISSGFRLTWLDRYPVSRAPQPLRIYDENGVSTVDDVMTLHVDGGDMSVADVAAALLAGVSSGAIAMPDTDKDPDYPPALKKPTRKKYRCDGCNMQLWGKPLLNVACGDCGTLLDEMDC